MQTRTGHFATAATLVLGLAFTGPAYGAERKVGQTPEPGVVATVSIGSTLLEWYNIIVDPGVILARDVDVDLGMQGSIRISAGSPMMIELDTGKKLKACTVAQDTYTNMMHQTGGACLTDRDKDGRFDTVSAQSIGLTTKPLAEPLPYQVTGVPENAGENNHRSVLVYLGAAAGVMHLSYREFSNDMARPASSRGSYLSHWGPTYPQSITWRDTKITLLGLDGDGLRYRVEAAK